MMRDRLIACGAEALLKARHQDVRTVPPMEKLMAAQVALVVVDAISEEYSKATGELRRRLDDAEKLLRVCQGVTDPASRLGFWSTLPDGTQVHVEAARDHEGTVYLEHVWKVPEAAREDVLQQLQLDDRDRLLDGAAALYDAAMGGPRP